MNRGIRFTRQELFEMIWSEPISRIATRLGSSDVAISKICKKMNIPRPPRGHWARVQHGHPVRMPQLPAAESDTPSEWILAPQGPRSKWCPQTDEVLDITVPERLSKPHRELVKVRATLKGARKDDFGRVRSADQMLHVTPSSVSRSIRVLTTLFRSLEERGHSISREDAGLRIWVRGEQLQLTMYEPTKRLPHPNPSDWGYPKWAYRATGRLILTISAPGFYRIRHQWTDTARADLEKRLGEIVLAIESAPDLISEARRAQHLREVREAREAVVRRRMTDQVRLTHQRAEMIEKLNDDWQKAAQIRTLAAAIGDEECAPPTSKRLARWAMKYADHVDPLKEFRIAALDQKPRKTFW